MTRAELKSLIEDTNENRTAIIERIVEFSGTDRKPEATIVLNIKGCKHIIKFNIDE